MVAKAPAPFVLRIFDWLDRVSKRGRHYLTQRAGDACCVVFGSLVMGLICFATCDDDQDDSGMETQ